MHQAWKSFKRTNLSKMTFSLHEAVWQCKQLIEFYYTSSLYVARHYVIK